MKIQIGKDIEIIATADDKAVVITRPCMLHGGLESHLIESEYSATDIAKWYHERDLIQNAFPNMSAEDREFLITGITPSLWLKTFGGGK